MACGYDGEIKLKKMKMVNLFGYVQTVEIKTKI